MNAAKNMNLSWNEITERSLKGLWKNIWPDLSRSDAIGHFVDMNGIRNNEIRKESVYMRKYGRRQNIVQETGGV